MSYTEAEVKKLLEAIGAKTTEMRGAFENRLDQVDLENDALKKQLNAIERALALRDAPPGGESWRGTYFRNIGEQLQAVRHAAMPGGKIDERLYKVMAASGASESVPSEGGFAVETQFAHMLAEMSLATGLLAPRCFRVPISTAANSLRIDLLDETSRATGSRYGGIQVFWAPEAETVTASKPKLRQIQLNPHKLFGLMYATDELLADAEALTAAVNRWFPQEFGFKVDDAIVNGTGAGMPLGILNAGCLVSVTKETGQAAATIIYENIQKMWARLLPSSRSKAIWLYNGDSLPALYGMSLSVGTGGAPVFLPQGGAANQPFASLFGRPMLELEQCATLGTVGDIILADLNEYVICDKGPIKPAVSVHVRFVSEESTFRWTYRIDGQPMRQAPLTPYKGTSNTRSPFIALATRS